MIKTKEEALAFCESYMKASKAFQACRNVPSIDASKAIASCILDITVRNILALNNIYLFNFTSFNLLNLGYLQVLTFYQQ